MTEKREFSLPAYLAEKAARLSRVSEESFSEAAGLYEVGDTASARSKVSEGSRPPELINDIASLINLINSKIEEVEIQLSTGEHSYSGKFSTRLGLPEDYRLDLKLILPEEKVPSEEEHVEAEGPGMDEYKALLAEEAEEERIEELLGPEPWEETPALGEEAEVTKKAYEPWQGEEIRFRKGTLGRQLSVILEGKRRPGWILEQKASEVKEFKGERIRRALSKLGAFEELTVENVLTKQIWRLKVLSLRTSQINAIQDAVKTFADNLLYSPEFKLLSSIYRNNSGDLTLLNAEKEEQLKDVVCEMVSSLTPREQKVLILRYGLDDFREQDYKSVADQFNVTRERIRQIEAKALRKLRHPSRSRRLTRDFVEFVEKKAATTDNVEPRMEQNPKNGLNPAFR